MNRTHFRALLIAASTLVATGAFADDPSGKPSGAEKAAGKTEKAAAKTADKAEKTADRADKTADKAAKDAKDALDSTKAKTADDRAGRKAKERDAQREKLKATWKGPVSEPLRQELRRHAERTARLERVKSVAEAEKDKDTAEKAAKLMTKENERHDKWLSMHASAAGVTPTTMPGAPGATTDGKEGAR